MNIKNFTLLLTLSFGVTFILSAQTMTEGSFPMAGDVFSLTLATSTGFNPGSAGTNVSWNFASLTPNDTIQVDSFMSPSITPYATVITNASIADHTVRTNGGNDIANTSQYVYYNDNTSSGGFQRVANILPDTVIYTTTCNQFPYPFSFGSTSTGTYYAHYGVSQGNVTETGNLYDTADATGILTTPLGTFGDILRVKSIRNELDTAYVTGLGTYPGTTTVTYYTWNQPNSYYPIMEYMVSSTVFPTLPLANVNSVTLGYRMGYATSAINSVSGDNTGWVVYPNPASSQTNIVFQAGNSGKTDITLFDVSGRTLQQLSSDNTSGALQTMQLNLENIPAGIYLLTIRNSNGMATRKLEVSK